MLTVIAILVVTTVIATLTTRYSQLMAAGVSGSVVLVAAILTASFFVLLLGAMTQGVFSNLLLAYSVSLAALSVVNMVLFFHSWKKLTQ